MHLPDRLLERFIIVAFAIVREHNLPRLSGTAIGFANGIFTSAGALYQPLTGWLLDLGWRGQMSNGARIYDVVAYQYALSAIVAGTFIALLCTLLITETYCKPIARPEERAHANA